MIKNISITPADAADDATIKRVLAEECGVTTKQITGYNIQKRSIDARAKQARIIIQAEVSIDEPPVELPAFDPQLQDVSKAPHVVIVGAGPAGLFAALRLITLGYKPIILERGKDVRSRRRDLAAMIKAVGEDNCMFETDFPHPTCLYPDGIERGLQALSTMEETSIHKVMSGNAIHVYSLPEPIDRRT